MNWGKKILIVYIVFITGILFLVFKSSSLSQDLVVTDYYEQELKYQDKIDETERANGLSSQVKYKVENNNLIISYPEEMKGTAISANVVLYYPADKSKDIQMDLHTNDATMILPLKASSKGLYELKISWEAKAVRYYFRKKIVLP